MGKGRIRHPKTVTIASTTVTNVNSINWKDNDEYDRSKGDDQMSGDPVKMNQSGSGSIELMAGDVPACYGEGMSVVYNEVVVESGSETVTEKTTTFTKVTINAGANVPAEGRGNRSIDFEYATATTV